jgi:subtilisin family serine protease
MKHLLKLLALSALLATSSYAAVANMSISTTESSIKIDTSGSVGSTTIYVWKNGRYFTKLTGTDYLPLVDATYKFLMVAKDSDGKKYKLVKKTVSASGAEEVVNAKPTLVLTATTSGQSVTVDSSQSTDSDGTIVQHRGFLYKNGRYFKVLNSSKETIDDLPVADYKILFYVMDDKGDRSAYGKEEFTIKEIPVVAPVRIVGTPDYTLGTPGTKDLNPITAEYKAGNFLEKVNAAAAYEQGWTGAGVKVAVLDTGIDADHSDLADNIKGTFTMYSDSGEDLHGHGTHVAGIIAATKDDEGMHGVAYNADIISIKVLSNSGSGSLSTITAGIKLAAEQDAKVANLSLGTTYWSPSYYASSVEDIRTALKADTSLIFAAGNNSGQCKDMGYTSTGKCNYPAALPAFEDYADMVDGTYDGAFIAVGSISDSYNFNYTSGNGVNKSTDDTLAYYSNAAGITKDWYIVAPGGDLFTASGSDGMIMSTKSSDSADRIYDEGDYNYMQGTSMAAPVVTGAFALLAEKFPYLVGREIRDIMFATTTDLGEEGVDDIYGHGLLNIEKAMQPVGTINIPTGGYITSTAPKFDSSKTQITSSSAFGSALSISALSSTLILDDFNRGYTLDMTSQVANTGYAFDADSYQQMEFSNSIIIGLDEASQSASIGTSIKGFKFMYAQSNDLFGTTGEGAMSISGKTQYLTIDTPTYNGLTASVTYGTADGQVGGMFTDITAVTGMAAKLTYVSTNFNGGIKLPMRVDSGSVTSVVPTSRAMDGSISNSTQSTSLAPAGQEVSVYANYNHRLTDNSSLEFTADYTQDQMNISGMDSSRLSFNHITKF